MEALRVVQYVLLSLFLSYDPRVQESIILTIAFVTVCDDYLISMKRNFSREMIKLRIFSQDKLKIYQIVNVSRISIELW